MQNLAPVVNIGAPIDLEVSGIVIHGFGRGHSLLNFETANIDFDSTIFNEKHFGVYCGYVQLKGEPTKMGIVSIGKNPTIDNAYPTFEVHILDFKKDIYDEEIRVKLVMKMRDMITFKSIDALIKQIASDAEEARKVLKDGIDLAFK